jgi:hypothetical protein
MSSQVENKDKKVVDLTSATYLRKFHVTKHHKQKKERHKTQGKLLWINKEDKFHNRKTENNITNISNKHAYTCFANMKSLKK